MNVQERVSMCLIIEQMKNKPELSKRLGLENKSTFRNKYIDNVRKGRDICYETIKKELF